MLSLDMAIEEPGRLAVEQRGHEAWFLRLPRSRVDHMVERVVQHAGGVIRDATRAEGELAFKLGQGGIGEEEGRRGDLRLEHRVTEHALQLRSLDGQRGRERDRPVAHEDDTDRAVRYGRREVEFALLEVELDDVAPQHQIPNRRDALALERDLL